MDKLIAVIVLIFVIAVLICGELYFKMEKKRTIANTILNKMQPMLFEWTEAAGSLFEACGGKYPGLFQAQANIIRSVSEKHPAGQVDPLNQICSLAKQAVSEHISDSVISGYARHLSEKAADLFDMREDYNKTAAALNEQLGGPLNALLGRLFHIEKMTLLSALTVL